MNQNLRCCAVTGQTELPRDGAKTRLSLYSPLHSLSQQKVKTIVSFIIALLLSCCVLQYIADRIIYTPFKALHSLLSCWFFATRSYLTAVTQASKQTDERSIQSCPPKKSPKPLFHTTTMPLRMALQVFSYVLTCLFVCCVHSCLFHCDAAVCALSIDCVSASRGLHIAIYICNVHHTKLRTLY